MKCIVAGSRSGRLTSEDKAFLDTLGITILIHGGTGGIDSDAGEWAQDREIPTYIIYAKWKDLGRPAGPRRKAKMAKAADAVVLMPGGIGTQSMFNEAIKAGITIYDRRGE